MRFKAPVIKNDSPSTFSCIGHVVLLQTLDAGKTTTARAQTSIAKARCLQSVMAARISVDSVFFFLNGWKRRAFVR